MNDSSGVVADYAILGCGSVGYVVAQELDEKGNELVIFDRDPSRVEALRDQDINAAERDITDPEIPEMISSSTVVLILTSEVDDNLAALRNIREENPNQYVIVRASDPVSQEELEEAGADFVINPPQVIAESALRALETGEMEHRVELLLELIEESDSMAVVVLRSFESDEIGSAAALEEIGEEMEVETDVVYTGTQRHQRHQAFANLLDLEIHETPEDGFSSYDLVVAIDGEDIIDEIDVDVDVLIGHNPTDEEPPVEYSDVRGDVGSTSTVLTKYIQEVGFDLSSSVHTGLLHGIRSETSYFRRNTTPADLTAAAYLFPFADKEKLETLESPSMSGDAFEILARAINGREVHGSSLLSGVGFVGSPDALSWSAEALLDLEGVTTTVVFGVTDDEIRLAGRSKDVRVNISNVLEDAFADKAETVGHTDEARASVPLGIFGGVDTGEEEEEVLLELVDETVKTNLFEALNIEEDD